MNFSPIWITIKLAFVSTFFLLLLGIPLAWWLSRKHTLVRTCVSTLTSLPLVLPPTVLGFYLLILLSPEGAMGVKGLAFSFEGLVIGSVIYSLPFVIQPLQNGFESIKQSYLDVASTLGASPLKVFFKVALPLSWPSFMTACILGFAHTLGEFGVVLMIGGNIPGETRVLSIAIYDAVESLNFELAHWLSAGMVFTSFILLLIVSLINRKNQRV